MTVTVCSISNSVHVLKRHGPRALNSVLPALARSELERLQPGLVLSSLAPGWSAELAWAAIELRVPVVGVLKLAEYSGGKLMDPVGVAPRLLRRTEEVLYAARGHLAHEAYQEQHCYMIEHSEVLLVLHDGKAGTISSLVNYAHQRELEIVHLWSKFINATKESN